MREWTGGAIYQTTCFWMRRGGRVVEGAALEKRYARKGIVGSNPTLSEDLFYLCFQVALLEHLFKTFNIDIL
jgi:hypothetical protein